MNKSTVLENHSETIDIIKELWEGKSYRGQMVEMDEHKRLLQKVCNELNELSNVLPDELDELLENYSAAENDYARWCEREAFRLGVEVGKRLAATQ